MSKLTATAYTISLLAASTGFFTADNADYADNSEKAAIDGQSPRALLTSTMLDCLDVFYGVRWQAERDTALERAGRPGAEGVRRCQSAVAAQMELKILLPAPGGLLCRRTPYKGMGSWELPGKSNIVELRRNQQAQAELCGLGTNLARIRCNVLTL